MSIKNYILRQKALIEGYKYNFFSGGKNIKTHKNNTSVIYFEKKKFYRKYSFLKEGINKITAERLGLIWYCKLNKIDNKKIIINYQKKNKFAYLDINKIHGKKIMSWKSIDQNYVYLKRVLKHYKKILNRKAKTQIHGDLTLDNILFQKKNLFILDWEFFNAKKNFWGYDIVYLFLSAVCLPFMLNKTFSKKEEELFKKLWKELIRLKINKQLLFNPFKFFEKNIKSDNILKKSFKLSKSKFFPFVTNNSHKEKILKIIRSI